MEKLFKYFFVFMAGAWISIGMTNIFLYPLQPKQWHCTSYDYNADMCIQYSKRDK